ncbi:hypothetical protein DSO57_1017036 [Entomophthora muscae]|uniref:Uncharacterized protein n=1 Tax=Entomophthora muscae TaxID=34485 RepID=A0ACC2SHF5_9FUNG|nr:hypothetical protein DSO57_1017036 [Entomophthora muscae]
MGKATMLSKPRSCCCCIDLRTGCIVLAILQILGGGGLVLSLTNLAMQRVSIISFNFVYSVVTVTFAGVGLYGIVKREYKKIQYLEYFMLVETIILGVGLVIGFIAILALWDVICASTDKGICQTSICVVIAIIPFFLVAWLLKLHFYFVLNSYVDQLKKCLFVPTNMDQVVVPVTPIFEQIPHLPVQETPHPEPFYFVMPQPHSKA